MLRKRGVTFIARCCCGTRFELWSGGRSAAQRFIMFAGPRFEELEKRSGDDAAP